MSAVAARLSPPFRAEHIGSLIRPPELLAARAEHQAGRLDDAALRRIEDQAIREIVAYQEGLGYRIVTDGEFRRGTYTDNFTENGITGVRAERIGEGSWTYRDNAGGASVPARIPTVYDRIRHASRNAADFAFLQGIANAVPKYTLPGPCYIHFRAGRERISRDVYPDLDQFWSDLVAAYHTELQALHAAGCRYLQLDETSIAKLPDPNIRSALTARGDDPDQLLELYTDVINAVVAGAPKDMRVGIHLCRGNSKGKWQAEGGYDTVAEHLFRKLSIGFFFLEYDSPRAGSFEPLRLLPDDKLVVLGLVSTKQPALEAADLLESRIAEASRFVPLDRLCLSPQCGFSGGADVRPLTRADQEAKMRRIMDVSRKVWH